MIEIKIPEFGESIQEVQISTWYKQVGDWVEKDEDLVELESEKASQALPAPEAGVIEKILHETGTFAKVGDIIAVVDPQAVRSTPGASSTTATAASLAVAATTKSASSETAVMPAAARLLAENQLSARDVEPTGPGMRILKEDVLHHLERRTNGRDVEKAEDTSSTSSASPAVASVGLAVERTETVKPMSMIRRTIAARLVEAQQTAALLTTFNEIDMHPVMELRKKYKDVFAEKHGVKLGFMSFFAKASVEALRRFPAVNAEIRGNDVIYRNYCDIGVAIGGGKGLVVPVLRSVERMSFAEIEKQIGLFGKLAMENKIKPQDLSGGTFTISNGGVYGSLLSTPIVNPPQSGILGLHAIQERPIALNGQVVIRPMMYVALTYDHRIVDGREAVQFLKTIKEVLEEPARLFLEV
ncbi:MAG TPA: 2-oxoglutarate dehydrogenase complex dihydrolipoyllysine-residue succinyltransferase [Pirellulaceae bacterium]|nr:2-oxoglutarate dehydrogenase complex dihydrolipoyllysine-residue succinyltransferase [Pirellulaceae bacterium]HMO91771.1 2-oxoglutarate dehydrogenase complex dihydrolipoyllysine-residue succinyltransferase [Pirellulaceae bacterium]HMP69570.1 2-oxoglutarate dehydrogenase complex dihydrolipoyllysine-residue succinyltransferase [Pirellulaceae bacterium]